MPRVCKQRDAALHPSLRAARASTSSSVTNPIAATSDPASTTAAASCKASAARNPCVKSSRREAARTATFGGTSCARSIILSRFLNASSVVAGGQAASLSRRAKADQHSVGVPHQTAISLSASSKRFISALAASSISRGTKAELSHKFIALAAVRRGAPRQLSPVPEGRAPVSNAAACRRRSTTGLHRAVPTPPNARPSLPQRNFPPDTAPISPPDDPARQSQPPAPPSLGVSSG